MKAQKYRSSSIQIKTQRISQQKSSRAKSNQMASQRKEIASPARSNTSQQDKKKSSFKPLRKLQKSLTEQRFQQTAYIVRKTGFTSKRYKVLSKDKKIEESERDDWKILQTKGFMKTKNDGQQQRQKIRKLDQIRKSMQSSQKFSVPISYRDNNEKQKKSKQIRKLKAKPLKDYLEFINAKQTNYSIGFDYSYLRNLSRQQAASMIDFSSFTVLESIQLCMLDVFEDSNCKGGNVLLKEYCELYFKLFQKNMMQVVLCYHYFKLAYSSLVLFFTCSRIAFAILYSLACEQLALTEQYSLIKQIIKDIVQAQKIMYQGKNDIQIQKNYVSETLRLLKITTDIERRSISIALNIKQIQKTTQNIGKIKDIIAQFQPLQKQINFYGLELQFLTQTQMSMSWNYFKIPPIPFLPTPIKRYTLAISIQNLLIHYNEQKKQVLYRPYLDEFLNRLECMCQLVAFCNEPKQKADQFINCIESTRRYFHYRLYKEHLTLKNGKLVKDLSKLGRQTEKIMLVDTIQFGPGIWTIMQFKGSTKDRMLITLQNKILSIFKNNPEDLSNFGGTLGNLQNIQEEIDQQNTISSIQE